jgi:hypothetical protein
MTLSFTPRGSTMAKQSKMDDRAMTLPELRRDLVAHVQRLESQRDEALSRGAVFAAQVHATLLGTAERDVERFDRINGRV